jgi:hypothetical protein
MRKWQKKFLSRGPATVVYYVEQLNTDPELVGSQPAAASARRISQKVHSRIPATVAHIYSRRARMITPFVEQLISSRVGIQPPSTLGDKDLVLERAVTVVLMLGTTIYCSGAMRKFEKIILSRGPGTVGIQGDQQQ